MSMACHTMLNHKYGFELGSLTFQFLIFVFSTVISFFFLLRSLWNDCLWLAVARSEAVVGREPCCKVVHWELRM